MKRGHVPMRMCVGCRQVKPKRGLLRLASGANGSLSLDHTQRSSGRGVYLCYALRCAERAFGKGVLAKRRDSRALEEQVVSVLSRLENN